MKILIFLLLSFGISLIANGQALEDINKYLKSPQIPDVAKEYYQGKFQPGDDDSTYRIMDSISTKNNFTRPFYLLLASRMLLQTDGGPSEVLCDDCEQLFENKPDFVMDFLNGKNKLVKSNFRKEWAGVVVDEITMDHEKEERQYLPVMKKAVFRKCSQRNKANLQAFYSDVYRQLLIVLKNSQ